MNEEEWRQRPRKIFVVVDNESWILPFAETLVGWCLEQGDDAKLCRNHHDIKEGIVAFYLGCTSITLPEILTLNKYNMVVHESSLPKGKGFAPMTWQILEGKSEIPICLFEANEQLDTGNIALRDVISLKGHELCAEWRHIQGEKTIQLCQVFLDSPNPLKAVPQKGDSSSYQRRQLKDSRVDPNKTIAEQFDLLRVVDNNRYPAFFEYRGQQYKLTIEKDDRRF